MILIFMKSNKLSLIVILTIETYNLNARRKKREIRKAFFYLYQQIYLRNVFPQHRPNIMRAFKYDKFEIKDVSINDKKACKHFI